MMPCNPSFWPSSGGIDLRDAVRFQLRDLFGYDNAAAAAEHLDMLDFVLSEEIDDIFKELHMAALVAAYADRLSVFLNCRFDDLGHGSIVSQMYHFGSAGLEHPSHDVDRRVMTVE